MKHASLSPLFAFGLWLTACGGGSASVGDPAPTTTEGNPTTEPVADTPVDQPAPPAAPPKGPSCGAAGCGDQQYCSTGEFACGVGGTCAPRPGTCASGPTDLQCGCDNHTYVSACEAAAAGVAVRHAGSCNLKNGQDLTCKTNAHCAASEYCHFIGDCGKSGKGFGVCKERPTTCSPPGNFQSCGCDGATYASACEAARAGVSTSGIAPCGG